ncbi:MAG: hypothetical protein EBZ48_03465 [Proteobacteria bacterium]|nr:hypothetical protein [Pseudomonadota bacterium]
MARVLEMQQASTSSKASGQTEPRGMMVEAGAPCYSEIESMLNQAHRQQMVILCTSYSRIFHEAFLERHRI